MKGFLAIAVAASILMLATGAGATVSVASPQPSMSEETVKAALDDLFAARCDVITGGSPNRLSRAYGATVEAQQRVTYDSQYLVKHYVEPYAYNKYTISNCRYQLSNITVSIDGTAAKVNLKALLRYDWGRPDWSSTVTAEESEGIHTLALALSGGRLMITQHQYEDFFHGHLPTKPFQPAQVVTESHAPSPHAFLPNDTKSLDEKLAEEKRKQALVGSGQPRAQTVTYTYDSVPAASYAYTWALSRNWVYPDFDHDCTNFVSQTIFDRDGGWVPFATNTGDSYEWYAVPYCSSLQCIWSTTGTWRLVIDFRNMLLYGTYGPHGTSVTQPNNLLKGDVMIWDFDNTNYPDAWDHTTIVHGYAPDGTPLLAYHSTDTRNRAWNTITALRVTAISMDTGFDYPDGTHL